MIDFHTHILPHFDDGAKDTATATEMLRQEVAQGVTTVLLTSHYYGKKRSPAQYLEKRNAAFERLCPLCPEGLTLRLGAEVHFTGINLPNFEELCSLAIEGTKYILIEFPFTNVWIGSILEKLSEFVYETGYTPIIAHAERYRELQKDPRLISKLLSMGCLIQVNAGSFLNKREKKLAFALLKHGFVHCIGSDAHDMEGRSPDLLSAKAAVEKANLLEEWERAQAIMEKVLAGEQVCVEQGKPIKKFLGKYL